MKRAIFWLVFFPLLWSPHAVKADHLHFGGVEMHPPPPPPPSKPSSPPWFVIQNLTTETCSVVQQHSGDMGGKDVASKFPTEALAKQALQTEMARGICK